jgi:tetratricopeptide (TPR) repeat protein
MDDQRFLKACQLREEGKLREAIDEFFRIVEVTEDPIDKAGVLVYAAATLRELGDYDDAMQQLSVAKNFVRSFGDSRSNLTSDYRLRQLEVLLDFEEADIWRFMGRNEEALAKFNASLKKYGESLHEPEFRDMYEMIQTRRAFLLADLGRWKESLPILEETESSEELREGTLFYLGHCYLSARDYVRAEEKLIEALRLGLPKNLEYRAHCELGMVYASLGNYTQAKSEFEKSTEKADAGYIKQAQLWKRLEAVCRGLGLKDEADRYARLAMPS